MLRRHSRDLNVGSHDTVPSSNNMAILIAVATVVIALAFVAYAWSGADLCLWCAALGR